MIVLFPIEGEIGRETGVDIFAGCHSK
jgi:hypothetical protein